jgi:hypothetical protein
LKLARFLLTGAALAALPAEALEWKWSYQGEGVRASGAFTTKDAANADGFYEITGITGEANGVAIKGLQPPGTSIPGNDGYPVDDLVRVEGPSFPCTASAMRSRMGHTPIRFMAPISPRRTITRSSPTRRTTARVNPP